MNTQEFSAALRRIFPVLPRKTVMEQLKMFNFIFSEGEIEISATDLDISVRERVAAQVPAELEGELRAVEGKATMLAVRGFRSETTKIILSEGDEFVHLKSGRSKVKVRVDKEGIEPFQLSDKLTAVDSEVLIKMSNVIHAVSQDDTRPNMCGVSIKSDGAGNVSSEATDGHRFSGVYLEGVNFPKFDGIIQAAALQELKRMATMGDVSIAQSGANLEARSGSFELQSRLVDGKFPDLRQVLNVASHRSIVTMDADEFSDAVRFVDEVCQNKKAPRVVFILPDGVVRATSENGRGSEREVTSQVSGPELGTKEEPGLVLCFNPKYYLDASKSLRPNQIRLLPGKSELAPMVMTRDDDLSHIEVVMPMRA